MNGLDLPMRRKTKLKVNIKASEDFLAQRKPLHDLCGLHVSDVDRLSCYPEWLSFPFV